ncbi:hypothetical protein B0O99DRAFT_636749 [Bisporella sp. PMI_857]|nr:hypothetical protein B0O99DRAFT_636749 [Bisporella sp. PMI_857]
MSLDWWWPSFSSTPPCLCLLHTDILYTFAPLSSSSISLPSFQHLTKFTKIDGSRRGKVCEMCGTRHRKYILSCKRCHMLACEDCRRYRI